MAEEQQMVEDFSKAVSSLGLNESPVENCFAELPKEERCTCRDCYSQEMENAPKKKRMKQFHVKKMKPKTLFK